jgi:hypothetical protein
MTFIYNIYKGIALSYAYYHVTVTHPTKNKIVDNSKGQ